MGSLWLKKRPRFKRKAVHRLFQSRSSANINRNSCIVASTSISISVPHRQNHLREDMSSGVTSTVSTFAYI